MALAVLCVNAALLARFHDQFWWPPDEGNYAHVAERILDGEVLHADVQDIHPGYVNFVNAGALALFGRDLVSMRYPLAVLGVVQSLIIFLLLRPIGVLAASVGATAITALGFLQFLDPTAHWYCLFLVILLAGVLHAVPPGTRWRLDTVGAIVATILLFRQLTGVLVAMGALTYLFAEATAGTERGDDTNTLPARGPVETRPWLARAVIAVMLVGLLGYLARATDRVGWMLFGVWPVVVLLHAGWATRVPNKRVVRMLAHLALGGIVASLPLLAYHLAHGSLGAWYQDVVVTALRLPRLPFFESTNYSRQIAAALSGLALGEPRAMVNGVYWALLYYVAAVTGALLLRQLLEPRARQPGTPPPALAVLAVFYAVVSVHYQIPVYLTYTVGLSFAALLYLSRGSKAVASICAAILAIAVYYHAGQPVSRMLGGVWVGERINLVPSATIPRLGLRVEQSELELYDALVQLIHREVPAESSIFAVPSNAELYFLSDRRNPFRFFNSALGVTSERELAEVLETLDRDPPVLVFFQRGDKYNTRESLMIMDHVAATFEPLPPIGDFEIFRRPAPPPRPGSGSPYSH